MIGELGLDGRVCRCTGILPIVAAAKKEGCRACTLPFENAKETAIIGQIQVIGVKCLAEVYPVSGMERFLLKTPDMWKI